MPEPAIDPRDPPAESPDAERDATRRAGITPVSLFLVLLLAYVLIEVKLILVLVLLSLLFATLIERPVEQLEQRHIPRALGILISYIILLGGLALLGFIFVPVISREAHDFRQQAPAQIRQLETSWQQSGSPLLSGPGWKLLGRAADAVESPPIPQETAIRAATSAVTVVVGIVAIFVITFYYLMERQLIRRLVLEEIPLSARPRVRRVWDDVESKVGGWLRGQLLLCLTVGITATIGYGAMGIRFWALLGLLAGVTEFMPIIGPWLGGVAAVIMALTQSWEKAAMVTGFIICLQFLENTILVPRIMKGAVGLTPLTIFVAILAGTEFIGIPGALLAIPIAAAIQVIISSYLDARREASQEALRPLPSWRWMRGYLHAEGSQPAERQQTGTEPAGERGIIRRAPDVSTAKEPGWTAALLTRAAAVARRLAPQRWSRTNDHPDPPERRVS